jgi:hypothetical protein
MTPAEDVEHCNILFLSAQKIVTLCHILEVIS